MQSEGRNGQAVRPTGQSLKSEQNSIFLSSSKFLKIKFSSPRQNLKLGNNNNAASAPATEWERFLRFISAMSPARKILSAITILKF